MQKGRSLGEKISAGAILASIGAVIVFILLAAVSGIIGGRADAIFVWLWDLLARSITANSWPWILTSVLFLTLVAFSSLWWLRGRALNYQLATMSKEVETKNAQITTLGNEVATKGKELASREKMLELDESLLRLIASVMSEENLEKAMKNLVLKFLMSATSAFPGDVHRASLLLPDAKKEYLRIWEGYQMPDESKIRTHFYIGTKEMDRMRGIAGEAFFYRQLRVAHIKKENGRWERESDSKGYIEFDKERPYPPYCSLVCVPIFFGKDRDDCLGVVCFDSENTAAFDPPEVQKMLKTLAKRIASILFIYQQLQMANLVVRPLQPSH